MSARNPHIVYCHHTKPDYIPPPRLSENMVVVGPFMEALRDGDRVKSIATPKGRYDLASLLKALPAEQAPEIILVSIDATALNEPANLAAFDCPKVALLADTHHLTRPLRNALAYLADEAFDFHIALYNLHHAHFFRAQGLRQVHWLPSLNVVGHRAAPVKQTIREILFVGQSGIYHPRRRRLFDAIEARALPLRQFQAPAAEAARHYRAARISLNCSLNGDLNMRVFEIMAAGGLVLTDRLAPQSGLSHLFREGEHLAAYGSVDELLEKAEYYLGHAEAAARIAAAGEARYGEHFASECVAECLWDLIFERKPAPLFDVALDARSGAGGDAPRPAATAARLAFYEYLQELHRRHETLSLLALPGTPPELLSDAADLPRLSGHLAHKGEPDAATRGFFASAGVARQIADVALDEATEEKWDVLIAAPSAFERDSGKLSANGLRFVRLIIPGLDPEADNRIAANLEAEGFIRPDSQLPLFERKEQNHIPLRTPQPSDERIKELQKRYGLSYHVPYALSAEEKIGLRGKRVLEVGGNLPADFVFDQLGTKQWIGIVEPNWRRKRLQNGRTVSRERLEMDQLRRLINITTEEELGDYEILAGAVEELPSALFGHFDVVFSIAAFEHFLKLPAALGRMYQALRPGGRLFAMAGPIWSAHDGHHLPPITDNSGVVMDFHSSSIPRWGHLLMRPPEMYRHLLGSTDAETAQHIVYEVYHSSFINRLFTEDYVAFLNDSAFEVVELTGAFAAKIDAGTQQKLESLHPGRKHFANNGLRIVLRRPE